MIDVPQATGGKVLRVLMNADLDEASGFSPRRCRPAAVAEQTSERSETASEDHWHWRLRMAERMAARLDPERFGVKAMYVFGSTKNATAGPGSDIDLLVHFQGTRRAERESGHLAGGLEPLPGRDQLPAHRLQDPTACSTSTS